MFCIRTIQFFALMLVVLFTAGCQDKTTPRPTPIPSTSLVAPSGVETGHITALGTIRPAQTLQLSFGASGTVRTVKVRLGAEVKPGDLLAELDTAALESELQSAREEVARRQAALDGLMDGPDAATIGRAESEHAQQVAQAEIALQMARWQLEQARLQEQADLRDHALAVALAQSKLEQLDLQLAQARAQSPAAEVVIAQIGLTRAQDALGAAQVEYQKALDRPWEPQRIRDAHARAVQQAQQEVQLARAQLDSALSAQRAHALSLELLAAQRDATEAQLTQTLDAQAAYTVTLRLLAAEVDLAQLRLEGLQAWTNPHLDPVPPHEIAQTKALLRQAELAVAQSRAETQGAEMRAPFDGVISAIYLSPGEWGAPGVPVLEVMDTSHWYVETRNVGELSIGQVQVGQKVLVRVHAFQRAVLHGRVATISPVAVVQQGDTTYTLMIELDPTELNLRPGMNVRVEIQTE